MPRDNRRLSALSAAQREIMDIVWGRGEVAASEVREVLSARRKVSRNTVRTLLERMEDKGWLKHREQGRTFLYSAAQPREATVGQKVAEVLDQVCGGSPEALMTALIGYRGLSAGELDRIRAMLDEAESSRPPTRGGR
jgi:BlaI family penicillinase repressor